MSKARFEFTRRLLPYQREERVATLLEIMKGWDSVPARGWNRARAEWTPYEFCQQQNFSWQDIKMSLLALAREGEE